MAVRQTDPDVEVLVESIRARLLRAHDRAGALRYVHFVLDGWNGEALPPPESYDEESTTTPEDTLREAGISSERQAKYQ